MVLVIETNGFPTKDWLKPPAVAAQDVLRQVHGENFKALQGKVAIITGASNGLGLENARCS